MKIKLQGFDCPKLKHGVDRVRELRGGKRGVSSMMKYGFELGSLFLIALILNTLKSYGIQGTIDSVVYFKPGEYIFQDSVNKYFPENIFGLPSSLASKDTPEARPEEIMSLGLGGEIIVTFKDFILKDREGVDFVIFENAFINPFNQGIFSEPAKVSVSKDGINFIEFQYDSMSLVGLAGITPTNNVSKIWQYPDCGGDGFDLAQLGLDYIKYIKITDISEIIETLPESSKYWNPPYLLSGFDLDAIVAYNLETLAGIWNFAADNSIAIDYKNINEICSVINPNNKNLQIRIFDVYGRIVFSGQSNSSFDITLNHITNGLYLVAAEATDEIKTFAFIK